MDGEPRVFGTRIDMGADEFTDVDGDNMADYWETDRFGDTSTSDGTGNDDDDGLTDFEEYLVQTDPLDADTDDDLGDDGFEVGLDMDPLDPDADLDGMWDGWEAHRGLDWTTNDAALDPDADSMVNVEEFLADTLPMDSNSFLGLRGIDPVFGGIRLDWHGGIGSWQWLERSRDLEEWDVVIGFPPPTPVTNAVWVFDVGSNATYRIRAERVVPAD
jgi:hypothetical protein